MEHAERGNMGGCPKLPGYTFEHHHVQEEVSREPAFRRQTLVQQGDHMVVRAVTQKIKQDRKRMDVQDSLYGYDDDGRTPSSYEPFVPAWIKYQNVVLCFNAICGRGKDEDTVRDDALSFAVRIVYHLYDSTFEVLYDDGDWKGRVFIKRYTNHSDVEQPCVKGSFDPFKIQIGDCVEICGRPFTIIDADQRTREFRGDNGCPVMAPLVQSVQEKDPTWPKQTCGEKITSYLTCTRQTLYRVPFDWNGVVLRFWATCEDEEVEEESRYLIHYHPEDSSIELRKFVDSGQSKTCRYLSRTTLVGPVTSMIHAGDTMVGGPLQLQDVLVGRRVTICGKQFFVFKTDESSLQWLRENVPNLAEDIHKEISMTDEHAVRDTRQSKQHNKSCQSEQAEDNQDQSSHPAPPGVNAMQFLAQFSTEKSSRRVSHVDKERKFVITVHCSDETVSIREMHRPNSGTIAGKFLERQRAFSTYTDRSNPVRPFDFHIGVHVQIYGRWFEVLDADIATMQYIATNPQYFASTDGSKALLDVRNVLSSYNFDAPSHNPPRKNDLDPIWNGHSELLEGLKQYLPQYSMQQLINACILLAHE